MAVVDIGKSEKCSVTTLVALSRLHKLEKFLLRPFSLKRLDKANKSKMFSKFEQSWHTLQIFLSTPNIIFPTSGSNIIGNSNNNKILVR